MASVTSRDVLARGFRVLGRAIRDEPRIFTFAVGGSVLFGGLVVGSAYVIGHIVGKIIVPALETGEVNDALLWLGAAALLAISAFRVVGIFGRRLGAGYMQFRLQARYRRLVTGRYLDLPLSWHHRHATGTLLSNANSDVEAAWFPIAPLPFAVGTMVMLFGAVGSLFFTDWVLALVGVATFVGLALINVFYSRRMAPRQARAQLMRGEVSAIAHESFDGALVVKTMGREGTETDRFAAHARELRDALISVGRLRGLFDPLMETLPSLGTLAVLVVGTLRLRAGDITVTDLVSVAFLFTVLAFPVRAIGWVLAELPRSVAGWDRLQHVLTATGEMRYGTINPEKSDEPARLAFDGVDYAYPAGADTANDDMVATATAEEQGPTVLHDISLVVPEGRTVALVGPTGSGKSTIASLAVRLVDPDKGRVIVDEHHLRDLTAAALAGTTALVAQIPFIFDDTVRANVALDREGVDDEVVWAALRLAQADGFIRSLPEGLDTMVGERGTSLSGGQRQRLTLARALAGKPRLLILDDATSAVDPRVEAAILAGLRGGEQPTSILVVAYRRATIALADEVVYLEHGRVVAAGTHQELLASTPGYADLVTAYERAEADREREHVYEDEGAVTA
ncbi:ABC-type multidrug transport system fused ATPase/permease subunit [Asanoa ferruginea]|uniref:ABC-type multidrug transport system fused ATPase/permease subunit n=1 Tax=Asanoa ferruginea TaxID=53367 RepID=A0A3D9ZZE9_9ACTN|nr:ABC transporter ATP-binding protein [Asanoa ferruginea]REG02065.1 ABC-type multidrug transport system fused ATPase/permease subunit [Asanoa ferruginea]GIF53685.1 multidrug ABC transporter ATP-binding protein [Asanoa ferruginea]